jgi:membrane-bound ClpP family serine protease
VSWPIVLVCLGLVLILLEFLFPSLGALGVAAAISLITGIAWAFADDPSTGVNLLIVATIGVPAAILLGMKLLPKSPLGRLLINPGATFTNTAAVDSRDQDLLGREGVVEAMLRPAGVVHFDGRRVDVVTRGEAIDAGARVRVIELAGNRVVVARVAPAAESDTTSKPSPFPPENT